MHGLKLFEPKKFHYINLLAHVQHTSLQTVHFRYADMNGLDWRNSITLIRPGSCRINAM